MNGEPGVVGRVPLAKAKSPTDHKRLQICPGEDAQWDLSSMLARLEKRVMSDPAITRLLHAVEDAMHAAEEAGLTREAAGAHVLAYAVRAMRDRLGGWEVAQALATEANRLMHGSLNRH